MIGICDSGIGGLLLVEGIHRRYPDTDILYYGDQSHMPYGPKSCAEIQGYFDDILAFYKDRGITDLIVACNTLCSCMGESFGHGFKIHEIITKTVDQVDVPKDAGILVFGTPMTIRTGRYQDLLHSRGYDKVTAIAFDDLAYDIEHFTPRPIVEKKLRIALEGLEGLDVGAVILACTHYPVYRDFFSDHFKAKVYDSCDLDFDLCPKKEEGKVLLHLKKSDELETFLRRYGRMEYRYD